MAKIKKCKDFEVLMKRFAKRRAKEEEARDNYYGVNDYDNEDEFDYRVEFLEGGQNYQYYLTSADLGPAAFEDTEGLRYTLKHERVGKEDSRELISSQYFLLFNRIEYHRLNKEFNEMKVKYNRLTKLADGLKAVMNESYK